MRLAVREGVGAVEVAPGRGDSAELPPALDRRLDPVFPRDMDYLPKFYSHHDKSLNIVGYHPIFYLT